MEAKQIVQQSSRKSRELILLLQNGSDVCYSVKFAIHLKVISESVLGSYRVPITTAHKWNKIAIYWESPSSQQKALCWTSQHASIPSIFIQIKQQTFSLNSWLIFTRGKHLGTGPSCPLRDLSEFKCQSTILLLHPVQLPGQLWTHILLQHAVPLALRLSHKKAARRRTLP